MQHWPSVPGTRVSHKIHTTLATAGADMLDFFVTEVSRHMHGFDEAMSNSVQVVFCGDLYGQRFCEARQHAADFGCRYTDAMCIQSG